MTRFQETQFWWLHLCPALNSNRPVHKLNYNQLFDRKKKRLCFSANKTTPPLFCFFSRHAVITFLVWPKWLHIEKTKQLMSNSLTDLYIQIYIKDDWTHFPPQTLRIDTPDFKKICLWNPSRIVQCLSPPAHHLVWPRGWRVTQKQVKQFQMVRRARQQHVESTLKAQQMITCMSNILGFPTNLSALWYCSCRIFNLQTTPDAQNILKKPWKHLSESTW